MHGRIALWIDVAVKALFVGLLAFGAFSGLEQFEGKAFGARLLTYPIAAAIVPVGWWIAGKPRPYPYALDTSSSRRSSSTASETCSTSTTRSSGGTTSTTS